MSHIEVRDLHLTFPGRPPVPALRGVDLDVVDGDILAVLGPSGCGKTTLLRVLAGMARADAGTVVLGGEVLDGPQVHRPPERRSVGLVPQEGALFPHLDVAGNVAFGLRKLSRAERRGRVADLLSLVGLPGAERRRPHELSGGQQQRVALARALAPRPGVVLLDEPFSALDTGLRAGLRDEVMGSLRAAGTTGVLVTHDQVEAMTAADVVAVMREGRIVQVGPPAELYRTPIDLWVGQFLGDAIVLPGRVRGSVVECALGCLPLAEDGAPVDGAGVVAFLRPEQVRSAGGDDGVEAKVRGVRFQGPDAVVALEVGAAEVTARWPSSSLPSVGDVVNVVVDGTVLTFPAV
jgi:iron(III) transport system ATP-binding protein